MMKKYFYFIALACSFQYVGINEINSQSDFQNSLSVNIGRSLHTTGDYSGFRMGFEYERNIKNQRFDVGFSINSFFANGNKIRLNNSNDGNYPVIMKGVENAFPDFVVKDETYYDRGLKSYTGNSERIFQLTTDMNTYYRILNGDKHVLKLGLGVSFAYVEETTITLDTPGTFNGEPFFSEVPIRLIIPSYAKWVDLGAALNLRYDFRLTDRTNVGVRGAWHNYILSEDAVYSAGVNFGVLF